MSNATQKNTTRITGSLSAPPTIKINIATPSYGSTYSGAYVRTLYKVLSTGPKNRVSYSFSDIDYADVVTARNYLISNFYFNKPDCSHILFIDDDMGFESEPFDYSSPVDKGDMYGEADGSDYGDDF